ncbi:SspB family protein [Marinivivus vitaminiproducens]|uniref:SspB family protein n=1 Tax=Marinivivus vitaminiproducens TaxID=3035935 RepID=UPI0027A9A1E6|nr:ClpXP protease specificity-enhancing factor SspB [Geminicoccaceae bacterium SCSIO 64248]
MAEDLIGYGKLVENALRGVVKQVMQGVVEEGLPGDHHFYITFRTDHPAVDIAPSLRARYPGEMTIVLQHQFWDLTVDDDGFSVSLTFSGQPQTLRIGYEAIKLFADPGVEFGLQFTVPEPDEGEESGPGEPAETPAEQAAENAEEGGAEVVTLDRFRKK